MAVDEQLTPKEANAFLGASIDRDVAIYAAAKEAARTQRVAARSAEARADGGGVRLLVQMLRRQTL